MFTGGSTVSFARSLALYQHLHRALSGTMLVPTGGAVGTLAVVHQSAGGAGPLRAHARLCRLNRRFTRSTVGLQCGSFSWLVTGSLGFFGSPRSRGRGRWGWGDNSTRYGFPCPSGGGCASAEGYGPVSAQHGVECLADVLLSLRGHPHILRTTRQADGHPIALQGLR